uniref:Phylloseptin-H9 n=1 Tax=Pithecopus hypochondrialis TaxID=317381 RepID=PLS9_PITHY|nr:RecName: Full=Phylloseptin-H9; Short=PLS-H9; AltName: Full=Phylloseptin-11; Short=PLS-11; AltName: Full=Phylloseptin-9; Short=PS-9; Flags: Precursor [Pithecopus hypochondrialis]CAJ76138.1 phylloseptin-11 protein precursor [Pithecopus hypochondrialis]
MAFLKKSLFLVLFLGLVSLSICEEEKRETEEEENDQEEDDKSEEKRFLGLLPSIVSGAVSLVKKLG